MVPLDVCSAMFVDIARTIDLPAPRLLTISTGHDVMVIDGWRPTGAPGDHVGMTRAPGAARSSLDDPHLLRALHGQGQQRALPLEPGQGPDRACRSPSTCPTQTGYDPDHLLAKGEVGKVGVPVVHLGHMGELLDGIPQGEMNTSMTINAPAAWLLGLYVANAEDHGRAEPGRCAAPRRTTSSRSTCPAAPTSSRRCPSRRLIVDMIAFCAERVPLWNPMNVCSYHLQEAGRHAGAGARLQPGHRDRRARRGAGVRARSTRTGSRPVFASISFFVNSGIRFVEETAKMRAFTAAVGPDRPRALRRHRPEGAPLPLRRAGEQPRPHRGAAGEQRAAHRARDARRHPLPRRAGPLDPAAGVERGPRPAAAVGPAVGAADAAGARLRDRPARVPRPVRGLRRHGAAHRRAGRRRLGRARGRARRSAAPSRRSTSSRAASWPATPSACGGSSRATSPSSA